jgi:hypothetical protein
MVRSGLEGEMLCRVALEPLVAAEINQAKHESLQSLSTRLPQFVTEECMLLLSTPLLDHQTFKESRPANNNNSKITRLRPSGTTTLSFCCEYTNNI